MTSHQVTTAHDHEADALPQAAGVPFGDYLQSQKRIIATSKRGPAFDGIEPAAVLFGRLCLHLHRQQWRDAVSVYLRLKATYGVPHAVPVEVTQLAGLGSIPWWETAASTAANMDAQDARTSWFRLACVMLTIGIKQVEQLGRWIEFAEQNDEPTKQYAAERRFFAEFVANMQGKEAA